MKSIIKSNNAPAAVGPYSQATTLENLIFLSGQLPINPHTKLMPFTIEEQTIQSLNNCLAILKSAGSDFQKVLKTTIYVTNIGDFDKINAIYQSYFLNLEYPARSLVEVSKLPKEANIEIEMVAFK